MRSGPLGNRLGVIKVPSPENKPVRVEAQVDVSVGQGPKEQRNIHFREGLSLNDQQFVHQ